MIEFELVNFDHINTFHTYFEDNFITDYLSYDTKVKRDKINEDLRNKVLDAYYAKYIDEYIIKRLEDRNNSFIIVMSDYTSFDYDIQRVNNIIYLERFPLLNQIINDKNYKYLVDSPIVDYERYATFYPPIEEITNSYRLMTISYIWDEYPGWKDNVIRRGANKARVELLIINALDNRRFVADITKRFKLTNAKLEKINSINGNIVKAYRDL